MTDIAYGKLKVFLNRRCDAQQRSRDVANSTIRHVQDRRKIYEHTSGEGARFYIPHDVNYIGLADFASQDGNTRNMDMLAGGLLVARDTLWETVERRLDSVNLAHAIEETRSALEAHMAPTKETFVKLIKYVDIATDTLKDRLKESKLNNLISLKNRTIDLIAARIADTLSGGSIDMAQAAAVKPHSLNHSEYMAMLRDVLKVSEGNGSEAYAMLRQKIADLPIDRDTMDRVLQTDHALCTHIQNYIDCIQAMRECVAEAAKAAGHPIRSTRTRG